MRILALIPARAGSKRLPGKNVRKLGGKPLITWSIDAVSGMPDIVDVMVSTDAPNIAEVAKNSGALVPWLRPDELASDTASSVDVAVHALDWYESEKGLVDGLLLLQPTSPFRTRETVSRGIKLFGERKCSVIGVSEVQTHPARCFCIVGGTLNSFYKNETKDFQPAFAANGTFYLISPSALRKTKSFLEATTVPMIMESPRECLDIDTEWDWWIAENLMKG